MNYFKELKLVNKEFESIEKEIKLVEEKMEKVESIELAYLLYYKTAILFLKFDILCFYAFKKAADLKSERSENFRNIFVLYILDLINLSINYEKISSLVLSFLIVGFGNISLLDTHLKTEKISNLLNWIKNDTKIFDSVITIQHIFNNINNKNNISEEESKKFNKILDFIYDYLYSENATRKYISDDEKEIIVKLLQLDLETNEEDCYKLLDMAKEKVSTKENKLILSLINKLK